MWIQKIGISIGSHYAIPLPEFVAMLRKIGFEAISPGWSTELGVIVSAAKECGLEIQSLHAPFRGAKAMWNPDEKVSAPAKEELFRALEDCHKYEIPILVMHTWIGFGSSFNPTEEGFANYGELVKRAGEYGIRIAFENTEGEEYLYALMERFRDCDNVGFCWDSGHELCYNHSTDLLAKFGDRLLVTHLNDNLGIRSYDGVTTWHDDLHLLPFDGIADWEYNTDRLLKARPLDILNFELNIESKPERHENDKYGKMTLEEYFTEAYIRACRVVYRVAQKRNG